MSYLRPSGSPQFPTLTKDLANGGPAFPPVPSSLPTRAALEAKIKQLEATVSPDPVPEPSPYGGIHPDVDTFSVASPSGGKDTYRKLDYGMVEYTHSNPNGSSQFVEYENETIKKRDKDSGSIYSEDESYSSSEQGTRVLWGGRGRTGQ